MKTYFLTSANIQFLSDMLIKWHAAGVKLDQNYLRAYSGSLGPFADLSARGLSEIMAQPLFENEKRCLPISESNINALREVLQSMMPMATVGKVKARLALKALNDFIASTPDTVFLRKSSAGSEGMGQLSGRRGVEVLR